MTAGNGQSEELRHERKYFITGYTASEIEQLLKFHPACFTEIYHERRINNIYFDSLGFDSYYGNIEGDTERIKARFRWYGATFGEIKNATLEFKIKKGLLGKKKSYALAPFKLNTRFSNQDILEALNADAMPATVRHQILSRQPALLNSYTRKYFISNDKQFRITIDKNLTFYRISNIGNTFLNKITEPLAVVMELKYDSKAELEAMEIGKDFPFPLTKSSKYLQGMERVVF